MSHKQISLSAGEWQIMERLWEKQPMTLMELVRALAPETGWSKSTIVTMVTRLEAKGAVTYAEGAGHGSTPPPSPVRPRPCGRQSPCSSGCTGAAWGCWSAPWPRAAT